MWTPDEVGLALLERYRLLRFKNSGALLESMTEENLKKLRILGREYCKQRKWHDIEEDPSASQSRNSFDSLALDELSRSFVTVSGVSFYPASFSDRHRVGKAIEVTIESKKYVDRWFPTQPRKAPVPSTEKLTGDPNHLEPDWLSAAIADLRKAKQASQEPPWVAVLQAAIGDFARPGDPAHPE